MFPPMAPKIVSDDAPFIELPGGEKLNVLTEELRKKFPELSPQIQRKTIRKLEAYLQDVYAKPQRNEQEKGARYLLIDSTSWQLAQCLRHSNPTRIAEAVAPLTFLVESHNKFHHGKKVDVQPALYLCVALSRVEGEEDRAINLFNKTISHLYDNGSPPARNLIWARANMARLYRNMGRVADASVQEKLTREWILGRPYFMPPSEIKDLLADDVGTGSHILDHPDIIRLFDSINQIGPNEALIHNNSVLVQYNQKEPTNLGLNLRYS
ncbi:hypothetical protein CPB83DRAFT_855938 [Crepidotus variabilis]|uniref:Uncharacterized protein n=1 Tax=Crepidotus variabilis TaxID=179855 RepID=A0A9P6JNW7_9AGAR|nr:hypothetical protein CPB83DRAFT_855938 [Crepidotus variabilis]